MANEISDVDLFGEAMQTSRERRGRPAHVRTRETSNRVLLMFARGASVEEAATALGITQPTLHKHYFFEVERRKAAALMMESKQLDRLNTLAEAGNVSAEKELMKALAKGRVSRVSEQMVERQAKAEKLGKKARADKAAKELKGRFATRQPPSLAFPAGNA